MESYAAGPAPPTRTTHPLTSEAAGGT